MTAACRARGPAWALGLSLLARSAWGTTEPASIDIEWNAPQACGSREQVVDQVTAIVGQSGAPVPPMTARVTVTPGAEGGWHATVDIRTAPLEEMRSFDSADCDALTSAVAVILAVAAAGDPVDRPPEPEHAVVSPAPPRRVDVAKPPKHEKRALSGPELTMGGTLNFNLLPSVAPGGEMTVGWTTRRRPWNVRATLGAALFAPESRTLPTGEGATFWLASPAARVCGTRVIDRVELGPCLGAEVEVMWAAGVHGPGPAFQATPRPTVWWAGAASLFASYAASPRLRLFLRADAMVPAARPTFVVSRTVEAPLFLYRPDPWAARTTLGAEMLFF